MIRVIQAVAFTAFSIVALIAIQMAWQLSGALFLLLLILEVFFIIQFCEGQWAMEQRDKHREKVVKELQEKQEPPAADLGTYDHISSGLVDKSHKPGNSF